MENCATTEITSLRPEEIKDPHLAIVRFFDIKAIEYWRKELWECLKAANSNHAWKYKEEPIVALKLKKNLTKLIEACWLRLINKEEESGEIIIDDQDGSFWKATTDEIYMYPVLNKFKGRIRRLNKDETDNPFIALKQFFNNKPVKDWVKLLEIWAEHALSILKMDKDEGDGCLDDYEQLERLLEAAHLFNHETEYAYAEEMEYEMNKEQAEKAQIISLELQEEFKMFMDTVPPSRLNRNLRKMFIDFLHFNKDGFPVDFEDYLIDLYWLTGLLDKLQEIKNEECTCN